MYRWEFYLRHVPGLAEGPDAVTMKYFALSSTHSEVGVGLGWLSEASTKQDTIASAEKMSHFSDATTIGGWGCGRLNYTLVFALQPRSRKTSVKAA
jgi:hypothetical protein